MLRSIREDGETDQSVDRASSDFSVPIVVTYFSTKAAANDAQVFGTC